jgi:hypothetical protein
LVFELSDWKEGWWFVEIRENGNVKILLLSHDQGRNGGRRVFDGCEFDSVQARTSDDSLKMPGKTLRDVALTIPGAGLNLVGIAPCRHATTSVRSPLVLQPCPQILLMGADVFL